MICITPRAFALETAPLLKPLSCQAIAFASEAETPSCEATWPICDAVRWPGVAFGVATGTIRRAGAGPGALAAAADAVSLGSLRTVPLSRRCEAPQGVPWSDGVADARGGGDGEGKSSGGADAEAGCCESCTPHHVARSFGRPRDF